jgi:multidrug efflux system outer membrane protein
VKRLNVFRVFLFYCLIIMTTGCLNLGPKYERPELEIEVPGEYENAAGHSEIPEGEEAWWQVFNDPDLNLVVEQVTRNNLDVKQATARVLELHYQVVQTRAGRLPQLGLQAQAQRQQQPIIGILPGGTVSVENSTFTLALPASFEWDLWGRLARAEEASRAEMLQAVETRYTVTQTVVAEAVSLYLQIEALERQIQITERSIASFKRSRDLVEGRYRRGLSGILDVRQARRLLAQAESLMPDLRQNLSVAQHNLSVLHGQYPTAQPPRLQPEDYFKRLDPVPPGLPSDLLQRRPDVRAAEETLKSLNALVGYAKADRFPRITLTGNFGYSSDELATLFQPESQLYSIAADLAQPLFEAGRRKAAQQAAEARYQQAAAAYVKIVLTAFADVESALVTRREQIERRDRVVVFLREARAALEVAESRYLRGLLAYLNVLDAQQSLFVAEQDLTLVDLAILTNRVALHRALGGGWADPGPVEEPSRKKVENKG